MKIDKFSQEIRFSSLNDFICNTFHAMTTTEIGKKRLCLYISIPKLVKFQLNDEVKNSKNDQIWRKIQNLIYSY